MTLPFDHAVDQLNAPDLVIRLAALEALRVLATHSPSDDRAVVHALCAWLRSAAPRSETADHHLPVDVRSALSILLDREPSLDKEPPVIDLSHMDLRGAELADADLESARLDGVDLRHADLSATFLSGAELSRARLDGAVLSRADLSDAKLDHAELRKADLRHADLRGADLRGSDLEGARLRGADLSGADLRGANLRAAEGLSQRQLESALGDRATRFAESLTRPEAWNRESHGPSSA